MTANDDPWVTNLRNAGIAGVFFVALRRDAFGSYRSVMTVTVTGLWMQHYESVLRLISEHCCGEFTNTKSSCDLSHGGPQSSYL